MAGIVRPRGASPGGGRKLPPKGGARRTASVRLSKRFGELFRLLADSQIEIRPEHQAELEAIRQRNLAGTWNEADFQRLERISSQYVIYRKK